MKSATVVLTFVCLLAVLTPRPSRAQDSNNKSVSQFMKEMEQFEAVAVDPSASPEVRELNGKLLAKRISLLQDVVKKRIDALRNYKSSISSVLTPDEVTTVDNALHELEIILQRMGKSSLSASSSPYRQVVNTTKLAVSDEGTSEPRRIGTTDFTAIPTRFEASVPGIRPVANTSAGTKAPEAPQVETTKADITVNVASEQITGDKIRGPAIVKLTNVNVLRYDVRIGKDVTFPAGPDLKLPFIPPLPAQPPPANPAASKGLLPDVRSVPVPEAFKALADQLDAIELEKYNLVVLKITEATSNTNKAKDKLESLVSASDSILTTTGGPEAIIAAIPPVESAIDSALASSWPDQKIEELIAELDLLRNEFVTLRANPGFPDWFKTNKEVYEAKLTRVGEVQTQLNSLKSAGQQGTAFRDAQNKLSSWKAILAGVRNGGPGVFTKTVNADCAFSFDTSKETKIKLLKRDRLAAPGTAPVSEEIVTVVCSSPLTISGGFGFSSIDEREFVLVQSTKDVTMNGQTSKMLINRFGLKNNSSFRTLPVLLLNTRFWEPNDTFAVHASAGAAVDIKTGQAGTDVEFIVGPSLSFKRTLFITPGLHIGRVPRLAGGFKLDEEAPTGVSTPPIEKFWEKAFAFTFTFKLR